MCVNKPNKEVEIIVKENQYPKLCVCLGCFLSLLGVVIAAIIGKGDGVIKAFVGIGVRWLLLISSCVFLRSLGEFVRDNDLAGNNAEETISKSNWSLEESISPIDDSKTYTLICNARERYGRYNEKPSLIIRYVEGKTDAYIVFDTYLGSGGDIDVITRFDSCEAVTAKWSISKEHDAVFVPWDIKEFVQVLIESKKMVVRIIPEHKSSETFTFDVDGFDKVIDKTGNVFR